MLPQFRLRRSGVVVNVASTVTLKALPRLAVYTASKAAVVALTEVLALELAPLNVQVRVVLPGMGPVDAVRSQCHVAVDDGGAAGLRTHAAPSDGRLPGYDGPVTSALQVAEAI